MIHQLNDFAANKLLKNVVTYKQQTFILSLEPEDPLGNSSGLNQFG